MGQPDDQAARHPFTVSGLKLQIDLCRRLSLGQPAGLETEPRVQSAMRSHSPYSSKDRREDHSGKKVMFTPFRLPFDAARSLFLAAQRRACIPLICGPRTVSPGCGCRGSVLSHGVPPIEDSNAAPAWRPLSISSADVYCAFWIWVLVVLFLPIPFVRCIAHSN
jgi:hypothetical protein